MIAVITLCSLLFDLSVHSFDPGWTIRFISTNDTTHYAMTECALLELASQYLEVVYNISTIQSVINVKNGQCNTKPIINAINTELDNLKIDKKRLSSAIETVAIANARVDLSEMNNEAAHFDSEQFDDGAMLTSQRLDAALASAYKKEYEQARESFGALLHTVQDFYSHSNWIEIGHRVPNTGIGMYEVLGARATKEQRTCVNCIGTACQTNIEPTLLKDNILTSGYFGLQILGVKFDNKTKPNGKCSHGGSNDYTVDTDASGGGINKDTLKSDHGHLHNIAASVAYNASKQILNEFWTTIGNETFGQFLGLSEKLRNLSSNSLIIVMDDTGSMGPYIDMAKQIAISIVNIHQTLAYKPTNYILSPFNDPTWGPLTISDTPQQFTAEINKLYPHDGGDDPELYYHGIVDALKVCEMGSFLYAFTDAPAKDAYLKSQAVQLAKEKRVTITLFYAKSFRHEQSGRVFSRVADVNETLDASDGSDLASVTGGVTMGVNAQALNATESYIIQRLEADKMTTISFVKGSNMNFTFHVDSSIKFLQIEVTSRAALSSTNFRLIKPSGETFSTKPTAQTPYLLMYTVPFERDKVGEWIVVSRMNTEHTIQLNAVTETSCTSTLQKEIFGTSSNISFTPLTSQPIQQDSDVFVLTICENLPSDLQTGYVKLIDANDGSKVLETLSPIRVSSTGFLSKITIPDDNFRLRTETHLKDGTRIQRQEKKIISPTPISLTIDDQPYVATLNDSFKMNYTIYNHGQARLIIVFRAIDTMGLLSSDGVSKTYNISGSSQVRDTIIVKMINLTATISNFRVVTDSVMFSIATLTYTYDQVTSFYIQREHVPLTNQSNYPVPPKSGSVATKLEQSTIIYILFIFWFIQKYL